MAIQYDRIIVVHIAGLRITEPRIDFTISATADAEQNTGELTIYNLSRSRHEQIAKSGDRVIIEAGYKEGAGAVRLFTGVAQHIWKTRERTAFLTKITLGDALRSPRVKGGNTERTEEGEVSVRQLASQLVKDAGLEHGPLDAIPVDAKVKDFRVSGKPIDALKRLMRSVDGDTVTIAVDEDKVKFIKGNEPQSDGVRIIRSPSTGLVDVPTINEDGEITATMLLEPRARVGGEILIEDSEYVEPAPYTITDVRHEGSNWTESFLTTVDGKSQATGEEADA